jgi:hypothetical protein
MRETAMNCGEFREFLTLFVYDELPPERREACESHVGVCAECRSALEEVRKLHTLLAQRPHPELSPQLLLACRQDLDEALDREELGWHGLAREWLSPLRRRPATGVALALTLLIFGFSLGWTFRPRAGGPAPAGPVSPSLTRTPLTEADLANMRISGISHVAPDPNTGAVRITMDAARRVTMEGSLDDPRIQQVLLYAVKSYDNPGIRRDSLDALRAGRDKPIIRQALLYTMEHDPNVGVRLAALNEARGLEWDRDLRDAFLGVLVGDKNDGMRIAAIDVLTNHNEPTMLPTFQRLASHDASCYVRMKAASAVWQVGK